MAVMTTVIDDDGTGNDCDDKDGDDDGDDDIKKNK